MKHFNLCTVKAGAGGENLGHPISQESQQHSKITTLIYLLKYNITSLYNIMVQWGGINQLYACNWLFFLNSDKKIWVFWEVIFEDLHVQMMTRHPTG